MVVGAENPRASSNAVNGFEENTMAILDYAGVRNSRDVLDDKLSFLEAVRSTALVSDSPTAPSRKMFDAIFQILRGSNSLELAMASYQLLIDLDKHYPRICLKSLDYLESKLEPSSAGVGELLVDKEAWSPFCVGSETGHCAGEGTSKNSHHIDSLKHYPGNGNLITPVT